MMMGLVPLRLKAKPAVTGNISPHPNPLPAGARGKTVFYPNTEQIPGARRLTGVVGLCYNCRTIE